MKLWTVLFAFCIAGCSTETISTADLDKLNTEFEVNREVIADQDQQIAKLREDLMHESAEIEVNGAQSERLFIGPRLGSPY